MKPYHRHLIRISSVFFVVIMIATFYIGPIFTMNAENLNIPSLGALTGMKNMNRSQNNAVPEREKIDQQGYDTTIPAGFSKALGNAEANLFFNESTGEIALQDKITQQVWFSNPKDADSETQVEGSAKKRLTAQITVEYTDTKGRQGKMDSNNDCITYGKMSHSIQNDVLEVTYQLGKTTITLGDVPQQISKTRFDQFTKKLSKTDLADLKEQYGIASMKGNTDPSFLDKMKKKYKNIEKDDIYFLKYTSERILKKVKTYFDLCGYSTTDLEYDNKENAIESEVDARPKYTVVLNYRLVQNSLKVDLDTTKLVYEETMPPNKITVLEYFGAGNKKDLGYMLVPDGSGALIAYNNGRKNESVFNMNVYGKNYAFDNQSNYLIDNKLSLPVFGIKKGKAALLVTIDSGEALCSINARVSGMLNSYNTVFPVFSAVSNENIKISNDNEQNQFEKNPYRGKLSMTYTMLDQERSDYTGMAQEYRKILQAEGNLPQNKNTENYTLLADLIGGVPDKTIVCGFPVPSIEVLTDFSQAKMIAEELSGNGASGLRIKMEGWFNNGLSQKKASSVHVLRELGGEKGLNSLCEFLQKKQIPFYPEVFFSDVYSNGSGFSATKQNIRGLGRDIAVKYDYDYINKFRNYSGVTIYQLSPIYLKNNAESFLEKSKKIKLSGIAVTDMAGQLSSDFNIKHPVDRQSAIQNAKDAFQALASSQKLSLSNPNKYALKYASLVTDIPTSDSRFRVCDESVPFYQTVLRGYLNYVSPALNFSEDYKTAFLQAVEYGSGLQYVFTCQDTASLKKSDYNYINRGYYKDWLDTAVSDYKKAQEIFSGLNGAEITEHKKIAFNVYRTTYSGGTSVYVNYNDKSAYADGIEIPANGFTAGRLGK